MNDRGDEQVYDAFGEKTQPVRTRPGTVQERRGRAVAVAIFWSLAMLIVVGRVHYGPALGPVSAPIELASR